MMSGPPGYSRILSPSQVLNFITSAKFLVPCKVIHSQVLGIRTWASFGGRVLACHTDTFPVVLGSQVPALPPTSFVMLASYWTACVAPHLIIVLRLLRLNWSNRCEGLRGAPGTKVNTFWVFAVIFVILLFFSSTQKVFGYMLYFPFWLFWLSTLITEKSCH